MIVKWHGHSCFEFYDGVNRVVVDPHDGESIGVKPPKTSADVVLMSHDHYDHNASYVISGSHRDYLACDGEFTHNGMTFNGYRTYHDDTRGKSRGLNTIYTFRMEDMSFCHCGDLGDIPDERVIDNIRKTDFLFIPVGGVYTMGNRVIRKFVEMVDARVIVPMHYHIDGLTIPVASVDEFLSVMPGLRTIHLKDSVEFSKDKLPEAKECWIFSI
ncbi:MAG: MBL fold metallo-hydrolase [archaeon]|nr:MBL fold metallo-hydrolase [archaeon]